MRCVTDKSGCCDYYAHFAGTQSFETGMSQAVFLAYFILHFTLNNTKNVNILEIMNPLYDSNLLRYFIQQRIAPPQTLLSSRS